MAGDENTWTLAVVWRDPDHGADAIESYDLAGLTERKVCQLFGIKGSLLPHLPVPVHEGDLHVLQPYASEPLSLPTGTTGELWPGPRENPEAHEFWPLLAYTVFGGVFAVLLWHWGHTARAVWTRGALQLGAGLCLALAVWCGGSFVFLVGLTTFIRRNEPER